MLSSSSNRHPSSIIHHSSFIIHHLSPPTPPAPFFVTSQLPNIFFHLLHYLCVRGKKSPNTGVRRRESFPLFTLVHTSYVCTLLLLWGTTPTKQHNLLYMSATVATTRYIQYIYKGGTRTWIRVPNIIPFLFHSLNTCTSYPCCFIDIQ